MKDNCEYCGSEAHSIHEVRADIMEGYKKHWNNHEQGQNCWCKPIHGKGFLVHRNYDWNGTEWRAIRESDASQAQSQGESNES